MSGVFVYAGVIGFLAGVAARSVFDVPIALVISVGCAGLVAGAMQIVRRTARPRFVVACVFLVCAALGAVRAHASFSHDESFLDERIGGVELRGRVALEPRFTEKSQKVVLEVVEGKERARVSVITEQQPTYQYGDLLSVSGELEKPVPFETETGRMFDYPGYLAKDGIFHQMLYPDVAIEAREGGNAFHRALYALRRGFIGVLARNLSEPNASLLSGISIGAQDGMDHDTEEMFRRVGLIHIVVLSGYNITVVSDAVMRLLSLLPQRAMLAGGGSIIVLFVILTGASATAVRAGSMAVLALLARGLGRRYDIVRALFLVAAGMVLLNPYVLLHDPSFQLSFLATLGLITLSPILEQRLTWITNALSVRQTVCATLATQAFVLPLLVFMSGEASLISLVANVAVLPLVPISMFCAYILGIVGAAVPGAATALSFPAFFATEYILRASDLFSRVPFSAVPIGAITIPVLWGIYGALFILVRRAFRYTMQKG